MMTAETPREYDARITAQFEFDPACEKPDCDRAAAHAVKCRHCGDVRFLFCGIHAAGVTASSGVASCGDCAANAVHATVLYETVPLGAWLLKGAR